MPKRKDHLSSFAFFEATTTPMKTVEFGIEMGLLSKFSMCGVYASENIHLVDTERKKGGDGVIWKYRKCKEWWSPRRGSLFVRKHVSLPQIFATIRLWCLGLHAAQISHEVEITEAPVIEIIKLMQWI